MTDASTESLVATALRDFVDRQLEFLIVESGPYYVQFAPVFPERGVDLHRPLTELLAEHGLYAEAVSDEFLERARWVAAG